MKKWIALALALVMGLSLCACTENADPTPTDNSTTGNADPTGNENTDPTGSENTDPTDVTDATNSATDLSLMTEVIFCQINGDETRTVSVEFVYDDGHNIIGGKAFENDTLAMEATFDKDVRKPLVVKGQDEEGNKERQEYTYNENGDLLTEKRYINDELALKTENTYDEKGNMLSQRSYVGEEMMTQAVYSYDEYDNLLTKYYDNGVEDWTEVYQNAYEDGKLVQVKTYISDDLIQLDKFDADGNQILEIYYNDGEEYSRTEYTYEKGNLVKIVSYDDGEANLVETYTYNDSDKLLTRIISYRGVESHHQENVYDADGQLVEIKYLNNGSYSANTVIGHENGNFVSIKLYDEGELEGEYTFNYETANGSEEQAQTLTELYAVLLAECVDL